MEYYKKNPPKGEFVVIVGGMSESVLRQEEIDGWNSISVEEHMKKYTDEGMSEKEAMKKSQRTEACQKEKYTHI